MRLTFISFAKVGGKEDSAAKKFTCITDQTAIARFLLC